MGRKLDLSGLSDNEAEHVLQVVQRDMRLRKKEEQRLSELKQELDEEGSRCLLLSRQSCFNERCCIRCCLPFTFLLNPKRQCQDCHYNVCKACRVYSKRDKAWLCSACQKSRLLKTQSLEWFYTNLKKRFKRFGSAKVLKTLYRKHLAEHSVLSELTESSAYEESICNEGSFCGSDSTFYRQTQEHSMAETITVALRVAEEAIDEAISKAEFDTASQEKQNEAHYLREHRGELIEELSKTIVQKIISRRKTLTEIRTDYDQDWPLEHNTDLRHHQSDYDQASSSLRHQPDPWRSHTGLSLLDNDPPGLIQDSSLKKDGGGTAWKSVDRLDNAVLKSPDGNWIALQSAQLSRPSLLTRRKSLVFSALEKESEVVSAYQGMSSDNETKPKPDAHEGIPSPLTDSTDNLFSDSEGNWKSNKSLLAVFKRKVPAEIGRPSSSCRTNIIDVNFNVGGDEEEEENKVAAKPEMGKVRRSRKKRRSKKELSSSMDYSEKDNHSQNPSDATTPDTLTSGGTTPEPFHLESDITGHGGNRMEQEVTLNVQQLEEVDREARDTGDDGQREEKRRGSGGRDEDVSRWRMEIDLDEGGTDEDEEVDEEMRYRLYRLIAQSRLTYLSTDDDLDKDDQSEEEWERDKDEDMEEEKTDRLTSKLCQLEKEVRANQFSSTEDELDRAGVMDEEKTGEEEEEEEELAVKVCRLANQANATQFSSTDDELDRAGRGEEGEEVIDEGKLWKLQADKDTRASQLCDLASLVSVSQFSSTEDELEKAGENEVEVEQEIDEGGIEREEAMGKNQERRESFGDLDVEMFNLRDEIEERKTKVIQDKTEVEEKKDCTEERVTDKDERMVKGHMCEEKVELLKEALKEKETEERREIELETVVQAEIMEEIISLRETKVRDNQPEAKWPNKEEGEEGQEEGKIRESVESQDIAADSDEEDAEFDRIISGMLMMTLEDMQVETLRYEAAKNGRKNREPEAVETDENVKTRGFKDNTVDAQSKNASKETGSAKEFQSGGDNMMPESAVRERPGENVRDISREEESGDATGGDEKEQQEKDTDAQEKRNLEIEETKQTCKRIEEDDDEQEDRKVTIEWKMIETHGGAAEGDCESKERNERLEETKEEADMEQSSTSSLQEGFLSPQDIQNRYSAVSLCSITTEVLKVLNATEELLLQEVEGGDVCQLSSTSLPPNTDPKKLDQQFSRLEENVYMAAGEVYGLEAELSDLEKCARSICSATSDMELSFLEEQVASAAAKVQQSELQVCDISARIAALKSAGLNVETQQSRLTKTKTIPTMPVTVDSSRQLRRRLPAPPVKEDKEET